MRLGFLMALVVLAPQDPPATPKDRYGDPLPAGAIGRMGAARFLHDSLTMALVYSKDGTRLLSGGYDHTIRIWEASTGRQVSIFLGHKDSVESVAYSATELEVVSRCRDGSVRIWNVKDGTNRTFAPPAEGVVRAAALSPDGKQLALGDADGKVRLLDAASGESRKELKAHEGPVFAVIYAEEGKLLVTAGADGLIKGWNPTNGEPAWENRVHSGHATHLIASPAGRMLASGGQDKSVAVLEAATGKIEFRLEGHEQPISSLAFARDGKSLVSGDQYRILIRWDLELRKSQWRIQLPNTMYAAAFHPNGKTIAVGSSVIHLIDPETGKRIEAREGHEEWIECLQYSPEGRRLMSTSRDGTTRIWDAKSTQLLLTLDSKATWGNVAAYSSSGREIVTAGRDDKLRIWNSETGELIRETGLAMYNRAGGISFSRDGDKILFAGTYVLLLDAANGSPGKSAAPRQAGGSMDTGDGLALSPDGRTLITGHYSKVMRSWNAETLEETGKFVGHLGRPGMSGFAIAYSPDGRLVASSDGDEKALRLWDAATAKLLAVLEGHEETAHSLAFSPDGLWLASGGLDGTARIWDLATGKEVLRLLDDKIWKWVGSVAFSPDGRQLATGLNGTILTWSLHPVGLKDDRPFEDVWKDLASPDSERAFRAMWALADRGEKAAKELAARLTAPAPSSDHLRKLIADLGAESIEDRDRASRALLEAAVQSEATIAETLKGELPPEVKARLSQLLVEMDAALPKSVEVLQRLRALQAIEKAGGKEAMKSIAEKGSFQRIRRAAAAALNRLEMK